MFLCSCVLVDVDVVVTVAVVFVFVYFFKYFVVFICRVFHHRSYSKAKSQVNNTETKKRKKKRRILIEKLLHYEQTKQMKMEKR